ncbi:hypothetical protein [Chondromyces crocatus]|uniref:Secreted protein n=1 Tax=Chondromyces crocatus TaxID=52 RepID=A0A0K1EGX9_CHOCO|nr:hypothetical protein [Chondromyces crocatus]AKT40099.1 uncharacterized protein CMC5_042520 [Chondromyces crocatus]
MSLRSFPPRAPFLLLLVVGAVAACLGSCSSTENQQPPVFNATTSGPGTGGGGGVGGAGGAGGVDPACLGPDGCYACDPATDTQFHNACTDAQCSPFDDTARLPLFNGGALPPLP